jgi:hypothetical protein
VQLVEATHVAQEHVASTFRDGLFLQNVGYLLMDHAVSYPRTASSVCKLVASTASYIFIIIHIY